MNETKGFGGLRRLPKGLRWGLGLGAAAAAILGIVLLILKGGDSAPTAEDMERTVVVSGDFALSNTQLNYYFWSEYYYLLDGSGGSLSESLDPEKPLSEQIFDGETTWEDYILEQALLTVRNTMSMVFAAEEAGFTLPDSYETSLEGILERQREGAVSAGYVDGDGGADVDAYLSASYGPGATEASFRTYLEDTCLAAAYADSLYDEPVFTDQEISDYYDRYADDYAADGVAKDDTALGTLRVILVKPAADTDEAWAEAEASARTLLDTWQAESGAEEDFAALARTHSAGDTAADGGLLEDLAPSDLSGDLAAWAFAAERAAGDTAVLRSDAGWNAVYYVGPGSGTVWRKTAEADLRRETYQNAFRTICSRYEFRVNYDAISIAGPGHGENPYG